MTARTITVTDSVALTEKPRVSTGLPEDFGRVLVRGTFLDLGGNPLTGTVEFRASPHVVVDTAHRKIIGNRFPFSATLDDWGYFETWLPATDDPDITPAGWSYSVTEPTGRSYDIKIPYDTPTLADSGDPHYGQQVIDLSSVVPSSASPGTALLLRGVGVSSLLVESGNLVAYYSDGTSQIAGPAAGAHHGTHGAGGSDPITPGEIGASPVVHSHSAGDVASGVIDYSHLPVGNTTGTVAAGNDSRLSDARTPTSHASSHATGSADAITPAAIGAVARGSLVINVLDHGAVGDGTTDDTTACQDALDAVPASGGTLFVPPDKTFKLTAALARADVSNLKITGGGTLRQVTAQTSAIRVTGNSQNATLDGVTLIGPHTTQAGAGAGPGIYIGGTAGATCKDIRIAGCQISGFCHAGIMVYGGAGTSAAYNQNIYITRNKITDCQNGIFVYKNATSVTVIDNRVDSAWFDGILFDTYSSSDTANGPSRNVTAANNTVINSGTYGDAAIIGILFKGDHKTVSITGNEVIDTGAGTTYASPASAPIGIYVSSPTGGGVGTYYAQDVSIAGNIVTRGVGKTSAYHPTGIYVHYARNFSVTGNAVSDVDYGIQSLYSVNGLIQSNTVVRPVLRGLVIDGDATTKSRYIAVGSNTFRKDTTTAPIAVRMDYADTIRYTPPVHDFATELSTTANTTNLTDSRTPNAHAATHATGGTDPVSPASIGASATGHVHSGTDISSGTVAYARLPVGTTASTVAAGDDTRMTNARTPTSHATTHASGGSDPITPASIGASPAAQIQRYTTPGTYTWTKPAGCTVVYVLAIGGGAGGGSGRRGAAGTVRCGGGGGGGGGYSYRVFAASVLNATETVVVGAGGAGGAAVTADNTDGNAGTAGTASSFKSTAVTQQNAAAAGAGGTATAGAGGTGATTTGGWYGGNGGAASTTGGAGGIGTNPSAGASGGGMGSGAGGGVTSGDAVSNGGKGGDLAGTAGGAGGTSPGGAGVQPGALNVDQPSAGSGGGASSITGAAGAGANGQLYGAAGGGGGASLNGNASGAGGSGAGGIVVVVAV